MPVSAGVIGEAESATVLALVEVAAQLGRSVGLDGVHGTEVVEGHFIWPLSSRFPRTL